MSENDLYPTIHLGKCPVCGCECLRYFEKQIDKLWINDGYQIVAVEYEVCEDCGTVFQNPRPTDEWISEYYSSGMYRATIQGGDPNVKQRVVNEQMRRARYLVEFTREHIRNKVHRILDIGASTGMLALGLIAELECEAVGVEPDGPFRDYANKITEGKVKMLDNLEEAGAGYDVAYCIHTLEHVTDPVGLLRNVAQIANRIVVEVPHLKNQSVLRLAHLFAFTPASLLHAVQMAGLDMKSGAIHGNGGLDDETPQNILVVLK